MKLRQETTTAIISEVEKIKDVLFTCTCASMGIVKCYHFFCDYPFGDDTCIATDRAVDYSLNNGYFDIVTPHTETTIQWCDNGLELGSIEVWEDEGLCGTWSYEQIVNNEVEFNE